MKSNHKLKQIELPGHVGPATSHEIIQGLHEWRGHTKDALPWVVHRGDVLKVLATLEEDSFDCVVTSPPYYWQRDYQVEGQIGKESTIASYVKIVSDAMDGVRRVLKKDGLLFLNLGDTYYSAKGQPKGVDRKNGARRFGLRAVDASGLGVPRKTAIGIPWRVAIEMIARGWTLRSPIVWRREANPPEPTAKDRPWRTYEMVFMFSKTPRYQFYREKLNNEEDIWTISERPKNAKGIHAAAFPEQLVQKCLDVGCREGGSVLDPFAGSGTALRVALRSGRTATGIDLSESYCDHMVKELNKL
jgi:DNA modification methylase